MPKCEDCGKESDNLTLTTCPYNWGIYNEEVIVCICDDCYQKRANDD